MTSPPPTKVSFAPISATVAAEPSVPTALNVGTVQRREPFAPVYSINPTMFALLTSP